MTIRAGVLSDTHLLQPSTSFIHKVKKCFDTCPIIIHAGDITEMSILQAFDDKKIYAVHGNMCSSTTRQQLPESTHFTLGSFTIGLTHGAQLGYDIESGLFDLFPEADCMIYGHTHRPVCHTIGTTLVLNPGSFQSTGRYGAPGTYAIIEADATLQAKIVTLPH
jgi:putative phosphoesterase